MIVLDGKRLIERDDLHKELKTKFSLPEHYGKNLDALNDCLGERPERELIVIRDAGVFVADCGSYGLKLLQVFADNGLQILLD